MDCAYVYIYTCDLDSLLGEHWPGGVIYMYDGGWFGDGLRKVVLLRIKMSLYTLRSAVGL